MLEENVAQKLIDRFSGTTEYNINIMNDAGVIIASRDHSRIGKFHETAYRMLTQKKKVIEVHEGEQFLGTQPGINMMLENKGNPIGVVGITGNPDDVRPLALLLKASVEGLLEFELQQKEILQRHSSKDRFFRQLLYFEEPDSQELKMQAEELGYGPSLIRIPILVSTVQDEYKDKIADILKKSKLHTRQDMMIRTTDRQTLVFFHLKPVFSVNGEYRSLVEAYLEPVISFAREHKVDCSFSVGTIQNELKQYHIGYRHCCWLKKNVKQNPEPVYFFDHIKEYLYQCIPLTEFQGIFSAFVDQESDKFWEQYLKLVPVMIENNNNMVKSASQLHMHKNTLVYQYNQIRNSLNLNPISNAEDYQLASYLEYYLRQCFDV